MALSPPRHVKVEPEDPGDESDATDGGQDSDADQESDIDIDSRTSSQSQSQSVLGDPCPNGDVENPNEDEVMEKNGEIAIPETQSVDASQPLAEDQLAIQALASQMVSQEDEDFSQLEVDIDEVKKYEKEEQVVNPNTVLEKLRSGLTVENSLDVLNADEEVERPITPGKDLLLQDGVLPAYIGDLHEDSQVLEGVTQGFLVPTEPVQRSDSTVVQPPVVAQTVVVQTSVDDEASVVPACDVQTSDAEASSELVLAPPTGHTAITTPTPRKETGDEQSQQNGSNEPKEVKKKLSPLAEGAREVMSASNAGFPTTGKQTVHPEKKPKKWVAVHAVAPLTNQETNGQPSSQQHKVLLRPNYVDENQILADDPSASIVHLMKLKPITNQKATKSPSVSHLPPLAGQKRPLPPPGSVPPQGTLPPSSQLKDPLSPLNAKRPMPPSGSLPLQGILPPSSELKDPLSPLNAKENQNKNGPPSAKQTSILQHTTPQFKPKEAYKQSKIPEVKKMSKKLPSKCFNHLPTMLKHRCCNLCFKLFPSKISRMGGMTPNIHILTSECSFVRVNFQNVVQKLTCYSCFQRFTHSKTIIDQVLLHFESYDHEIICHHCRQLMKYSEFFDHLVDSCYKLFKTSVKCNRCKNTFLDCGEWAQHLSTVHKIVSPNLAHFNRFLPYELQSRELMLFALMHFNASS